MVATKLVSPLHPNMNNNSTLNYSIELPASYQERECAEYGKLGLMGSTILFASGDDGVAGSFGDCAFPNNKTVDGDHEGPGGIRFVPSWPCTFTLSILQTLYPLLNGPLVTCPFVTAVGATQVNPNATVKDPESASAQVIFSGGGFSDIYRKSSPTLPHSHRTTC
jgi:tripeptidyl-peptidase-1